MKPIDYTATEIRIAIIGLGARGIATMLRYSNIPGARVVAVCDLRSEVLSSIGGDVARDTDWRTTIARDDVDLIIVCTDWASHAEISIAALNADKHVACEVPAVMTLEQGSALLAAAAASRGHYTMLENCCYDPFALSTHRMVELEVIGNPTHFEGAYIHDLRAQYADSWYAAATEACAGNPYPTHGIGPISRMLDLYNDSMTSLVSMSAIGGINNTLISTARGRSILLQHDVVTPRPYSRLQRVCGTRGYISKYPVPEVVIETESQSQGAAWRNQPNPTATNTGQQALDFMQNYVHPWQQAYAADAAATKVSNLMNYIMDRRLIDCLLHGHAPDITAREAVLWSILTPLTHQSASSGSRPVTIPEDFKYSLYLPLK